MTVIYLPNSNPKAQTPVLFPGKMKTLADILSDGVCAKLKQAETLGHTGTAAIRVELIRGDLDTIARLDKELADWLARKANRDAVVMPAVFFGIFVSLVAISWLLLRFFH